MFGPNKIEEKCKKIKIKIRFKSNKLCLYIISNSFHDFEPIR